MNVLQPLLTHSAVDLLSELEFHLRSTPYQSRYDCMLFRVNGRFPSTNAKPSGGEISNEMHFASGQKCHAFLRSLRSHFMLTMTTHKMHVCVVFLSACVHQKHTHTHNTCTHTFAAQTMHRQSIRDAFAAFDFNAPRFAALRDDKSAGSRSNIAYHRASVSLFSMAVVKHSYAMKRIFGNHRFRKP